MSREETGQSDCSTTLLTVAWPRQTGEACPFRVPRIDMLVSQTGWGEIVFQCQSFRSVSSACGSRLLSGIENTHRTCPCVFNRHMYCIEKGVMSIREW